MDLATWDIRSQGMDNLDIQNRREEDQVARRRGVQYIEEEAWKLPQFSA